MRGLIALWVACAAAGAFAQESTGQEGAPPPAAGAPEKTGKPKKQPPDVTRLPFTPDSIKQVVTFYQDQIQGCYEEMLASLDKPAEGRLMTSFVINGEGVVKSAKVVKKGTTLKQPKLHACVVDVLSVMTFPKPPDGREHPIEYPFNLKAIK